MCARGMFYQRRDQQRVLLHQTEQGVIPQLKLRYYGNLLVNRHS
jgi:hypothetical protein